MLNKYIEDPNVLYIYEIGIQINGILEDVKDRDFLLICSDGYIPENFVFVGDTEYRYFEKDEDSAYNYSMMNIKTWFDYVTKGAILAWKCACLPKKFIHKEYVKLMLTTDLLQLRKNYDERYKKVMAYVTKLIIDGDTLTAQKLLWSLLCDLKFSNQIIENHKIINFKEVSDDYRIIVDGQVSDYTTIITTFEKQCLLPLSIFKVYTDGVLRLSKIKHIIQNE